MAELNKFQRSKDRIKEILNHLVNNSSDDEATNSFIDNLKQSIEILDNKMDEFRQKGLTNS